MSEFRAFGRPPASDPTMRGKVDSLMPRASVLFSADISLDSNRIGANLVDSLMPRASVLFSADIGLDRNRIDPNLVGLA